MICTWWKGKKTGHFINFFNIRKDFNNHFNYYYSDDTYCYIYYIGEHRPRAGHGHT